jgi:hypothetical protein
MKRAVSMLVTAVVLLATLTSSSFAGSLLKFKGGIGVIPVSSAAGAPNADGTFPNVNRNDVHGVPPGGQPWVISDLKADVNMDGRIRVDGRGLLLAGGNGIGTTGGQSVRAVLFCGSAVHQSGLVPLEADGDFRIDEALVPIPPDPCNSPVLLIVNGGGRWFAAGVPAD